MSSSSNHRLLTVVVSYNRPELLERTITSYRETVSLEHYLCIVDNGSNDETRGRINRLLPGIFVILLEENKYPGYATNVGWRSVLGRTPAPGPKNKKGFTLLHRSDNDMLYQPGWCEEVVERFAANPKLGQLGLRTLAEEGPHAAVGGNCVLSRKCYDAGVRYPEDSWAASAFEDGVMSQRVQSAGFDWERVQRPCAEHIGIASREDPYYQETFRVRGIDFSSYGL